MTIREPGPDSGLRDETHIYAISESDEAGQGRCQQSHAGQRTLRSRMNDEGGRAGLNEKGDEERTTHAGTLGVAGADESLDKRAEQLG